MFYNYGAACNCYVNHPTEQNFCVEVGGIADGESASVTHISDNLDKLEQHLINEELDTGNRCKPIVNRSHDLIGGTVDDIVQEVVSVITDENDVDTIYAVIFTEPNYLPTIVN